MIHHIFKIIWTERKINIWIMLEFILIFCILWFCIDYLYFMTKRYLRPKGYNIENIYSVNISKREITTNISDTTQNSIPNADLWTIYDRVKRHPAIEYASFSMFAVPYGIYTGNTYMVDTVPQTVLEKIITPEYFDVFNIRILSGRPFNENDAVSDNCIISADVNNLFAKRLPGQIKEINLNGKIYKVVGVANRFKQNEYEDYNCIVYTPLKKDNDWLPDYREFYIKVKPEADKNFSEQFKKEMKAQLGVGKYYLKSVTPIKTLRDNNITQKGYDNDLKSVYSISIFLFINIVLIVVATFWFRMQTRRSETALRMAVGASKMNVKNMFIGETLLLLLLASIVATVICINITIVDVLKDIGVPTTDKSENGIEIKQYFINYGITFLVLAIISTLAVWYPAKKASDTQPTEGLKDD